MTGLIKDVHLPIEAILDLCPYLFQVSIKKINRMGLNFEPAPAIDPRSPAANRCNHICPVFIIQPGCDCAQFLQIEWSVWMIVDSQVNIGGRCVSTPGARPAQDDGFDAFYLF